MIRRTALILALAACGGSSTPAEPIGPDPAPAAAPGASCDDVAAHVVDRYIEDSRIPPPYGEMLSPHLLERCNGDPWSAEGKACVLAAADAAAVDRCDEQQLAGAIDASSEKMFAEIEAGMEEE